jgi:hypothetical protein
VTVGELIIALVQQAPLHAELDIEIWRDDGSGVLRLRLEAILAEQAEQAPC